MKKYVIGAIAAIIVIGGLVELAARRTAQAPASSDSNSGSAESAAGIEGTVKIGPTCPVVRIGEEEKCADKPYSAELEIVNANGKVTKNFKSDSAGNFKVSLAPGEYTIRQAEPHPILPVMRAASVRVETGKFTKLNLSFDSGIR